MYIIIFKWIQKSTPIVEYKFQALRTSIYHFSLSIKIPLNIYYYFFCHFISNFKIFDDNLSIIPCFNLTRRNHERLFSSFGFEFYFLLELRTFLFFSSSPPHFLSPPSFPPSLPHSSSSSSLGLPDFLQEWIFVNLDIVKIMPLMNKYYSSFYSK